MVNLYKKSSRAIPVDLRAAAEAADAALANATYDPKGVLIAFNTNITKEFKSVLGETVTVNIAFFADPEAKMQMVGRYRRQTSTVEVYHSDLRLLHEMLTDAEYAEAYKYIVLKQPIDFVMPVHMDKARRSVTVSTIIHELTHALDPSLKDHGRLSYTKQYDKAMSTDPVKQTQFQKAYYNSPEEVAAYLQQCIFELANAWKATQLDLKSLFKHSRTLKHMIRLYGRDIIKQKVMNKLYSSMYQWMTERSIDPRTGKKKQG